MQHKADTNGSGAKQGDAAVSLWKDAVVANWEVVSHTSVGRLDKEMGIDESVVRLDGSKTTYQIKSCCDNFEKNGKVLGREFFRVTIGYHRDDEVANTPFDWKLPHVFTSKADCYAMYYPLFDPSAFYIYNVPVMQKWLQAHFAEKFQWGKGVAQFTQKMWAAENYEVYWRERQDKNGNGYPGCYDGYFYVPIKTLMPGAKKTLHELAKRLIIPKSNVMNSIFSKYVG